MSQKPVRLTAVLLAALVFPGLLAAQQPEAGMAPSDSDIYCAGFFTNRSIEPGLIVLGSEDGGFKNEYADRDIVYLSKGQGWINAPGGQYMLLRPMKDINSREAFTGQNQLMLGWGTFYAEIARIQVQILHAGSATAEVLKACEPIVAGDIAIPLASRPAPPYRSTPVVERFAPASGKATGLIVAAKEFQQSVGTGNVVYVNVGSSQGAQVGQYLRIFRTPVNNSKTVFQKPTENYAREIRGASMGRKLTEPELASLPRAVVGEVLVLSVEDKSATGIITFSREDVSLGDEVEVE